MAERRREDKWLTWHADGGSIYFACRKLNTDLNSYNGIMTSDNDSYVLNFAQNRHRLLL
jgi:hypothetical protein